jgi:regulator of nonsense transcripts 1
MSWGQNSEEVHMVVRIARRYNQRGLSFCIITFYDPQRAAISKAIKAANLPTGCVYNVDSFQGIGHPSRISTLISTIVGRERSRLCDLVFSPDTASRILELTASDERRSDPLPQRNGRRHQQAFLMGCWEEHAPGSALLRLVTAQRHLDRLEGNAERFRRASGITSTVV